MLKSFAPSILIVAASAVLLTGCMPGPVTPSPGPVEPSVSAPPTAAPPAPAAADYGFTFFEEAQMGASWDEMSTQLHYPVAGIAECPWYGAIRNTEIATTYAFMDPQNVTSGARFFYTNQFLAPDNAPVPRNAEGLGVGSTQAQVLAAYPSAVVDTFSDLGAGSMTRITVDDPTSDSKYVFAIGEGSAVVNLLQWGPDAGTQWSHLCTGL